MSVTHATIEVHQPLFFFSLYYPSVWELKGLSHKTDFGEEKTNKKTATLLPDDKKKFNGWPSYATRIV